MRRKVLENPVEMELEENGGYSRIDDIDDAITGVLDEVSEMEGCCVDVQVPVPFKCEGMLK